MLHVAVDLEHLQLLKCVIYHPSGHTLKIFLKLLDVTNYKTLFSEKMKVCD